MIYIWPGGQGHRAPAAGLLLKAKFRNCRELPAANRKTITIGR
jgi:hypothetical protein